MNKEIKSDCGDFMDITYNKDRTVISFHGKTEHGGVVTWIAMYDDDNRPAPMNRATHGLLMELDELYNIVFDANVVAAEMARSGLGCDIMYKSAFCTMVGTTDLCKIPFPDDVSPYGNYKWPKLTELHQFLFGKDFSGAHDALADVKATARCFWELIHRNLI